MALEVSLYRGMQLFNERKYTESLPYFKKSSSSGIKNTSDKGKYWEAETLYRLAQYEDALFKFNKLDKSIKDNSFPLLKYNIGYANCKLEQYDIAAAAFKIW